MRERIEEPAVPWQQKARETTSLLLIVATAFVFISLFTYHETDVSSVQVPPNDPVQNSGGIVGAHASYLLLRHFGVASFLLVGLVAFRAFQVFLRRRVKALAIKLGAAVLATLAAATLASVADLPEAGSVGIAGTAPGPGGIYGEAAKLYLREHVGVAGTYLGLVLALGLSLILATDWLLYAGFMTAARTTWRVAKIAAPHVRRLLRRRTPEEREEVLRQVLEAPAKPPPAPASHVSPLARSVTPLPPPPKAAPPMPYKPPPVDLFEKPRGGGTRVTEKHIKAATAIIEKTLADFQIAAKVVAYTIGPSVTLYEIDLGPGVKTQRVLSLSTDLATRLGVPGVRIVAPLPNRTTVGIEVPNPIPEVVTYREFLDDGYDALRRIPLPLLLGKTVGGEPLLRSLCEMPHLLIAGTTGFGKSVCLKSIITSLTTTMSPEDMKLVLIDPKMVELIAFRDIPHLWAPVITDMGKAAQVLDWLVKEMDDRYRLFEELQVSRIDTYNRLGEKGIARKLAAAGGGEEDAKRFPARLPYIVVGVDELADLMMTSRREVESSIIRLSQKSRAVGIHLVVATQRPSTDVVTGLIKSNMPARISFRVASHIESKIILDYTGAEGLVAKGEMLMVLPGLLTPIRAQCTMVTDDEVRKLVEYLRGLGPPKYHDDLLELHNLSQGEGTADDPLFEDAVRIVLGERRGSVSLLQRKLSIGYGRASRLIDSMEQMGLVGPHNGANPREVRFTVEQWEAQRAGKG